MWSGELLQMNRTYSSADTSPPPACQAWGPGRVRLPWLQIAGVITRLRIKYHERETFLIQCDVDQSCHTGMLLRTNYLVQIFISYHKRQSSGSGGSSLPNMHEVLGSIPTITSTEGDGADIQSQPLLGVSVNR